MSIGILRKFAWIFLRTKKGSNWKPREDRIIIKLAGKTTDKELAKLIRRSADSVRQRRYRLSCKVLK